VDAGSLSIYCNDWMAAVKGVPSYESVAGDRPASHRWMGGFSAPPPGRRHACFSL